MITDKVPASPRLVGDNKRDINALRDWVDAFVRLQNGANATPTSRGEVEDTGALMRDANSVTGLGFTLDEDDLGSNSAEKFPTQQSVKAYVDARPKTLFVACSDETTALSTGAGKITFRMQEAGTLLGVLRGSLSTAQTGGSVLTVDVNKNGSTILSTKMTFDNGEKTTATAATPCVISDTAFAVDDEFSIDIDQIGDGTAKGLKVYFVYKVP